MPESKPEFARRLMEDRSDPAKSYADERQLTAQSLAFHVDYRGGRGSEGVTWSHLGRYQWKDLGNQEQLRIVFGPMCGMEIVGHNLEVVVGKLREGQLKGVMESITSEATLAVHEGSKEPIILSVTAYPDFDTLFEEIKEEAKGDDKNAAKGGFTKRFTR